MFYCTPAGHEIKGSWCHTCYTDIKTDRLELDGFVVRKAELEKRKNDDEVSCVRNESWVSGRSATMRVDIDWKPSAEWGI